MPYEVAAEVKDLPRNTLSRNLSDTGGFVDIKRPKVYTVVLFFLDATFEKTVSLESPSPSAVLGRGSRARVPTCHSSETPRLAT